MTLYIDLPSGAGKLEQLVSQFDAEVLPGQPRGLDEVPPDKALICVVDACAYEASGYIITEAEFGTWTYPDGRPKTWLLMDRTTADELCPGATEHRRLV